MPILPKQLHRLSTLAHTLLLLASVGLAYWWLVTPGLSYYSLQAFSVSVVLYFVIKRLTRAKVWHLAPADFSLEMVIATFAFLLLIGSTGNTFSPFYSLTFIHLFFLVFSANPVTSIVVSASLILFHYGLNPEEWFSEIGSLTAIPLLLLFFLFTKKQYKEVVKEKQIIEAEEEELEDLEKLELELEQFLKSFVETKLTQLRSVIQKPDVNKNVILGQIAILEMEIERKLSGLRLRQREQEVRNEQLNAELSDYEEQN